MSLEWFYYITLGLGFTYIVGSALLGHLEEGGHDGGGDHGGGHDGGADHGADHGAGHGGDHSGDHGADQGHGHHDGDHDHTLAQKITTQAHASLASPTGVYLKAVQLLSPTRIALMLFFIGAFGALILRWLPFVGQFSLPVACVGGWFAANSVMKLLGMVVRKMSTTTISYKESSAVGSIGELTTSLPPGKTGEVTFVIKGRRVAGPARCTDPSKDLAKLSQVLVVDVQDGVFFVDPIDDEDLKIGLKDHTKISDP